MLQQFEKNVFINENIWKVELKPVQIFTQERKEEFFWNVTKDLFIVN